MQLDTDSITIDTEMAKREDLDHLYANPNLAAFTTLRKAAEERGWELRRTRGDHFTFKKPGYPDLLTLDRGTKAGGTRRRAIRIMQAEEEING